MSRDIARFFGKRIVVRFESLVDRERREAALRDALEWIGVDNLDTEAIRCAFTSRRTDKYRRRRNSEYVTARDAFSVSGVDVGIWEMIGDGAERMGYRMGGGMSWPKGNYELWR